MSDAEVDDVDLLILGGSGLLGTAVAEAATAQGRRWAATHHRTDRSGDRWHRVDLATDPEATIALLDRLQPRAIINAAYMQRGEDLWPLTAELPGLVASWSAGRARLVQLSSDVVFDGKLGRAYVEADPPAPVNEYGAAKVAAEDAVARQDPGAAIVRTSLLWGGSGDGGTHLRLLRDPDVVFFTDEFRNPVEVDGLAHACLKLADRRDITGLLHVAGPHRVDRLTFARALAPLAGIDPASLRGGSRHDRPDRPADVSLDSSLATSLLTTRLRGLPTD
ncbi:MAG: sugar nucleotide-binding protein [Actinomycetota bacterium]